MVSSGEIIFIWCISTPFYIIVEGKTAEEQTGQGNAGGMNILTVL
jgi:hypothetical protein